MKNNKGTDNKQNINRNANEKNMSGAQHKKRPEVRDNLDHRGNLENDNKGSDRTHNEKHDLHKPNRQK
jgi:hypothetical protein